ncbi:hypothetical protein Ae406Ps2_4135 [Pseudonocardia sp. Ae406_Ps2]|nr:hypothetical protein Ae331Ps2_1824c [Pseudonocardia sp. Ae331_Ps2]OLM04135.1 hypothetical protein Ae406Ps2_4135 [Pseudonocardia sp. Ae406_Ps2]
MDAGRRRGTTRSGGQVCSPDRVALDRSTGRFSNVSPMTNVSPCVHHSSPDIREEAMR